MSEQNPITQDEFQALEQKVLRAVEVVRHEREARAAAEKEALSLREQLATLTTEREHVRTRVEKMLQQMDELL